MKKSVVRKLNKRALSDVVSTLLILLLVFVAVAILWVVVRNVIQQGTEQVSLGKFTLDLKIEKVTLGANSLSVKVKRNVGAGEFSGLSFIIDDGENTEIYQRKNLSMSEYQEITFDVPLQNIIPARVQKIEVAPIFTLSSGKEVVGDVKDTYEIVATSIGGGQCLDTCTSLGYQCGAQTVCGVSTNCGTCSQSGYVCSGTICVEESSCTDTCASLGYECGTQTVCGVSTNCGTCSSGTCSSGQCVATCTDTCASLGYECGTQTVCGVSTNCGTCSSGTCNSTGQCTVSTPSVSQYLVSRWNFESSSLGADSKGTTTLTIAGGASADTNNYIQGASSLYINNLPSYDNHIAYVTDANLPTGFPFKSTDTTKDITVCAWVRMESLDGFGYIFSKGYTSTYPHHASFILFNNLGRIRLDVGYNEGMNYSTAQFSTTMALNRWYFVCGAYSDSTRNYRIRIWDQNANAVLGSDAAGTFTNNAYVGNYPICIGLACTTQWDGPHQLDARIDKMMVFNKALSASEMDEARNLA
jgi:hypothetical protein